MASDEPALKLSGRISAWDHGEATMESFIKNQMIAILKPFSDHIQDLDLRIEQLSDRLLAADDGLFGNRREIESVKADVLDLRTDLRKTDAQVCAAHDGIGRCTEREETTRQSIDGHQTSLQKLYDKVQEYEGMLPHVQRAIASLEVEHKTFKDCVHRTSDNVATDVRRELDKISHDLKDLRAAHVATTSDMLGVRGDCEHNGKLILETRQVLDTSRHHAAALQKSVEELTSRESQLSGKLEGWKTQWSKLHPALEAVRKDAAFLKQGHEHHETALFTLQQGYANCSRSVEDVRQRQETLSEESKDAKFKVSAVERSLADMRSSVSEAASLANSVHNGLQRVGAEVQKAIAKCDSVDVKQVALMDSVGKNEGVIGELTREQRKSVTNVQVLQHEVEKAHQMLMSTRGELDGTNQNMHTLRSELGKTNETVQGLDRNVEQCRAGFSGLQRGFAETGNHIVSRPLTLPRLPPGSARAARDKELLAAAPMASTGSSTPVGAARQPSAGFCIDHGKVGAGDTMSEASTQASSGGSRRATADAANTWGWSRGVPGRAPPAPLSARGMGNSLNITASSISGSSGDSSPKEQQ